MSLDGRISLMWQARVARLLHRCLCVWNPGRWVIGQPTGLGTRRMLSVSILLWCSAALEFQGSPGWAPLDALSEHSSVGSTAVWIPEQGCVFRHGLLGEVNVWLRSGDGCRSAANTIV